MAARPKYAHLPELDGPRPPCFAPEQWRDWVAGEKQRAPEDPPDPSGYCSVCTLAFQTIERAAGRCSHPGTTFVTVKGGDVLGIRAR